jgi:hypothetical protein
MAVGIKAIAVAVRSAGGFIVGASEQAQSSRLLMSNITYIVPADFIFI